MKNGSSIRIVVAAAAIAWAGLASAQSISGQVVGQVTDLETGKPVAGATVTATSPGWIPQTVTTDAGGNYVLSLLPPERYLVTASAKGFSSAQAIDVPVMVDYRVKANLRLPPEQAKAPSPEGRVAAR